MPGKEPRLSTKCMNYTDLYSRTAKTTSKSAIREMLKLADRQEVISFAGGSPSPSLFPVDDLKRLMGKVLDERGGKVLHYSLAEGEMALKQEIIRYMARDHIHAEPGNIVMLTGSQQGMDMLPKAFVNRGDIVFVETPSYVGAIQAFNNYGTRMIPIATDGAGMDPKALATTISKCRRNGKGKRMKMIYLIPDFQNPSGLTMSEERRIGVLEVAVRNNLLIVEERPIDICVSVERPSRRSTHSTRTRASSPCLASPSCWSRVSVSAGWSAQNKSLTCS